MKADKASLLAESVATYITDSDSDLYLYNGPIRDEGANQFIKTVLARTSKRVYSSLVLTTYGGDPDAGFRMARVLQRHYKATRLFVVGPCKSAGTLIAIGAYELIFGPLGELGPLDIQLARRDEMVLRSSGLDHLTAFALVQSQAFEAFEQYMLQIVGKSQGAISTKTACEIASQLVTGLFEPITAQIDPHRLGEVQRTMAIAKAYGLRLKHPNLKTGALDKLIEEYPSHSHVIDFVDSCELFEHVRELDDKERKLIALLGRVAIEVSEETFVTDLASLVPEAASTENKGNEQTTTTSSQGAGANQTRNARKNRATKDKPNNGTPGKTGEPNSHSKAEEATTT